MRTAGIAQLKAKLSEHIAYVKRGEEVVITERGKPVARIVPIPPAETDEGARIQRLVARGLLKLPAKRWTKEELEAFLARPKVKVPEGTIAWLMEEERRYP